VAWSCPGRAIAAVPFAAAATSDALGRNGLRRARAFVTGEPPTSATPTTLDRGLGIQFSVEQGGQGILDLPGDVVHRSIPPQRTVSTPSSNSRWMRWCGGQSEAANSTRSERPPSPTLTIAISWAQSKRGETRVPNVGMAIFIGIDFHPR